MIADSPTYYVTLALAQPTIIRILNAWPLRECVAPLDPGQAWHIEQGNTDGDIKQVYSRRF